MSLKNNWTKDYSYQIQTLHCLSKVMVKLMLTDSCTDKSKTIYLYIQYGYNIDAHYSVHGPGNRLTAKTSNGLVQQQP